MSHKRVAILLSGGGSNMMALLDSMTQDHPARACLVLSNNPDAGGLKRAAERGIPVAAVDSRPFKGDRPRFEAALMQPLLEAKPDILCLAGFMRVLTPGFVEHWRGRMLNIHPSLLPKFKGLHTHSRAIEAGERDHGCTVHEVTVALDDGPILGQARLDIHPDESADMLAARVLKLEHQLYPAILRRFAMGDNLPVLQL
ncbi:MAG: phosphoribosylglycinamide formyltransferase [Rhodobacteraceae bacterium]|nr:phosphoribosylglycinamide formyltransferase [Paracoccaceae bacterium]